MKRLLFYLSLASLAGCLAAPVLHFLGKLNSGDTNLLFLAASAGWFVFATFRFRRR
jgi:hypothetical protein